MMREPGYTFPQEAGIPESWHCVDCSVDTAPGSMNRAEAEQAITANGSGLVAFTDESEIYTVRDKVWTAAGMQQYGGCLCIGCLEKRLGRRLKPKDFQRGNGLNSPDLPATDRLLRRRGRAR